MERLLNLTIQPLWINMRREYFRNNPSRIELMLDIHDRIVKAITERNAGKAIHELEHHFDIQIEQIYNQNEENSHEHPVKPTPIAEAKGGDRGNIC